MLCQRKLGLKSKGLIPVSQTKKGRQPLLAIQKTLANWIQSYQEQGLFPTDTMIREKALFLTENCGDATARDTITHVDWLERFKQQYHSFAASPPTNMPHTNKSGLTVPSTEQVLGSMVRVLSFAFHLRFPHISFTYHSFSFSQEHAELPDRLLTKHCHKRNIWLVSSLG